VYNPSLGLEYAIEESMRVSLEAGYFMHDNDYSANESGMSASITLNKRFRRGAINVIGSGGYDESYYEAEDVGFSKYYEIGTTATYNFTRYISGNVFGSYRNDEYPSSEDDREDEASRAGVGLNAQVKKWMRIGLEYSYRTNDSTEDENDYDENRAFVSITLSPARPLIFNP